MHRYTVQSMLITIFLLVQCTQRYYTTERANFHIIPLGSCYGVMPYFINEANIRFYRKNANYTYSIYETDTLGSYVKQIFDGNLTVAGSPIKEDFTSTKIAFTMLHRLHVDINNIVMLDTTIKSQDVDTARIYGVDVFLHDLKTGNQNQITYDGYSSFIRWVGLDSMLVASGNSDTILQILQGPKLEIVRKLDKLKLFFLPDSQEIFAYHARDLQLFREIKHVPLVRSDGDVLRNSRIVNLYYIHPNKEYSIESIANDPYHPYFFGNNNSIFYILGIAGNFILLQHDVRNSLSKQENTDIILYNIADNSWKTLVKGVCTFGDIYEKMMAFDHMPNIKIGKGYILYIKNNAMLKMSFNGRGERLANINNAEEIYGMAESPNGRMWVFSGYAGRGTRGIFIIKNQ